MNMIKIEERFTSLTEKDLATVEGGRVSWKGNINIDVHKVIDSTGRFFGGIYNAGRAFGRNVYNAFY